MKIKQLKIFLITALLLFANSVFALEVTYPTISGQTPGESLSQYVRYIFIFFVSLAGFLAVSVLAFGAVEYMSSTGDVGKMKSAKSKIMSSSLGVLLLLSSYLILYTINPNLTKFEEPTIAQLASYPLPIPPISAVPTADLLTRIKILAEDTEKIPDIIYNSAKMISGIADSCDCDNTKPMCACEETLKCPETPWYTAYAHMDKMGDPNDPFRQQLRVGDEVEKGDIIGEVGKVGTDTGPHLHFQVGFQGTSGSSDSGIDIYSKITAPGGIKGNRPEGAKPKELPSNVSQSDINYILKTLESPLKYDQCVWYEIRNSLLHDNDQYWAQDWKCLSDDLTESAEVRVMSGNEEVKSTIENINASEGTVIIKHYCPTPTPTPTPTPPPATSPSSFNDIPPLKIKSLASIESLADISCPAGTEHYFYNNFQSEGCCNTPMFESLCGPEGNQKCCSTLNGQSCLQNETGAFCCKTLSSCGMPSTPLVPSYQSCCDNPASPYCISNKFFTISPTNQYYKSFCCPSDTSFLCYKNTSEKTTACCKWGDSCVEASDKFSCCSNVNSVVCGEPGSQICCKDEDGNITPGQGTTDVSCGGTGTSPTCVIKNIFSCKWGETKCGTEEGKQSCCKNNETCIIGTENKASCCNNVDSIVCGDPGKEICCKDEDGNITPGQGTQNVSCGGTKTNPACVVENIFSCNQGETKCGADKGYQTCCKNGESCITYSFLDKIKNEYFNKGFCCPSDKANLCYESSSDMPPACCNGSETCIKTIDNFSCCNSTTSKVFGSKGFQICCEDPDGDSRDGAGKTSVIDTGTWNNPKCTVVNNNPPFDCADGKTICGGIPGEPTCCANDQKCISINGKGSCCPSNQYCSGNNKPLTCCGTDYYNHTCAQDPVTDNNVCCNHDTSLTCYYKAWGYVMRTYCCPGPDGDPTKAFCAGSWLNPICGKVEPPPPPPPHTPCIPEVPDAPWLAWVRGTDGKYACCYLGNPPIFACDPTYPYKTGFYNFGCSLSCDTNETAVYNPEKNCYDCLFCPAGTKTCGSGEQYKCCNNGDSCNKLTFFEVWVYDGWDPIRQNYVNLCCPAETTACLNYKDPDSSACCPKGNFCMNSQSKVDCSCPDDGKHKTCGDPRLSNQVCCKSNQFCGGDEKQAVCLDDIIPVLPPPIYCPESEKVCSYSSNYDHPYMFTSETQTCCAYGSTCYLEANNGIRSTPQKYKETNPPPGTLFNWYLPNSIGKCCPSDKNVWIDFSSYSNSGSYGICCDKNVDIVVAKNNVATCCKPEETGCGAGNENTTDVTRDLVPKLREKGLVYTNGGVCCKSNEKCKLTNQFANQGKYKCQKNIIPEYCESPTPAPIYGEYPQACPCSPSPSPSPETSSALKCTDQTCFAGEKYHPCGEIGGKEILYWQNEVVNKKDVIIYYKNRLIAERKDLQIDVDKYVKPTLEWFGREIKRQYEQKPDNAEKQIEFLKERMGWLEEEQKYKEDLLKKMEEAEKILDQFESTSNNVSQLPDKCLSNVKSACNAICTKEGERASDNLLDTYGCHNAFSGCQPLSCQGGNPCPTKEIDAEAEKLNTLTPKIKSAYDDIIYLILTIKKERIPKISF